MVHLLDLNDDIHSSVLSLLDQPALRAMASSSQKGFQLASQTLVRTVKLSRNPQQVIAFCKFALKHRLCPNIISFTISKSAVYSEPPKNWMKGYLRDSDIPECSLFSSALAEVLERATNLTHLAFQGCTDVLLESEPRIANIICNRPPAFSLELSGADTVSLQMFTAVSGLAHLSLHTIIPPKYDMDAEQALDCILANSIRTLETLSLGHAVAANLRIDHLSSPSWEHVHHLSMTGVPLFPAQLIRPFPNLRSLEIRRSAWASVSGFWVIPKPPPYFQVDCPAHTLWPTLYSFSGPQQLAFNLSQHHRLRRISFMMWDMYFDANSLVQLSDTVRNSDLRSLALQIELMETPEPGAWHGNMDAITSVYNIVDSMEYPPTSIGLIGPWRDMISMDSPLLLHSLFSTLALWAKRLTYLSMHTGKNQDDIPNCLEHLRTAASLLAPLSDLKYVELGVNTWMGLIPTPSPFPSTIYITRDDLLRAWIDSIPSLEYLELNVVTVQEGWEHSWWRIETHGNLLRTVQRVSEEEGSSAKAWYDLEEWKS